MDIAILGFGSANRALARMLLEKSEPSANPCKESRCIPIGNSRGDYDTRLVPWRVVCIITRRHGRCCVPLSSKYDEIDLQRALACVESEEKMLDDSLVICKDDGAPAEKANFEQDICVGQTDTQQTLNLISLLGSTKTTNILVEAITSDPKGNGEPAISFIKKALESKMHVVSANKSPLAHCNHDNEETYWTLQQLARNNNVMYMHESSVMDGVPIFSLWKYALPHAKLISIRGCLNSTTTMILTRMEGNLDESYSNGESFEEALNAAKQMGIVEEDESLDVDGYDAAVKLRALLVVLTAKSACSNANISIPSMDEILSGETSIRNVKREDICCAYANGRQKYRVVATANLIDYGHGHSKRWEASVQLQLLAPTDPLYNLSGTDASVTFGTDVLGPVSVVSSNPTLVDTAYGLFSDLVRVASEAMERTE